MEKQTGFAPILRALQEYNYRVFMAGNIVSHLGTWVQRVGVGWLTWQMTESGVWLGVMSACEFLPAVAIAPIAGVYADRLDRLRMMKFLQALACAQAFLLAILTYAEVFTRENPAGIWLLSFLVLFHGIVISCNQPVRLAIVPSLVQRKNLGAAIGLNALSFNGARFIGPALAGIVVTHLGATPAFAFNSVTYALFIATLFMLRLDEHVPRSDANRSARVMSEFVDGLRYVTRHEGIGRIMVVLLIVSVFARAHIELFPGFADVVFNRKADGYGYLLSATGGGAAFAAVWLAQRGPVKGLTLATISNVFFLALSILLFTATDNFAIALASVFIAGFCGSIVGVSQQTLIQTAVDSQMRGRVMSIYGMIQRGGPALGALIMGTLSSWVGLRWPVAGGAVLVLLIWFWANRRKHGIARALEREEPPEIGHQPGTGPR